MEQVELVGRHGGSALVDLGMQAGCRIKHGRVRPRLLADADEAIEDRLAVQRVDDPVAGGAARETGGDHRLPETFDGARDVDSLAPGHRRLIDGAVTPARA